MDQKVHVSNSIRMKDRQVHKDSNFSNSEIDTSYTDFKTGIEDLQLHSLKFFVNALKSDKKKEILSKYDEVVTFHLKSLSENGSTEEIQSLALICLELFYSNGNLEISEISDPNYIQFLIEHKLAQSVPESNAALSLLSIIASEDDDESIELMFKFNIFNHVAELSPEIEFGELIYIILQHINEENPDFSELINAIMPLIPIMIESPNVINVCNGLRCISTLLSNSWECFDFESFHSSFSQFLLADNELIVNTAFEVLSNESFPLNESDFGSVLQCLKNGGNSAIPAIKFLLNTQEKWLENPPPEIFYNAVSCLSKLKYTSVETALQLIILSLKAPGIEFNSEQIQTLSNFLGDRGTARFLVIIFNLIWERVQAKGNSDWFKGELASYDNEIEQMISYSDESVSTAASKLLDIIS